MAAQAGGARWANVYRGDRVSIDGVEVVARHPAPADWERQKVRNDDSLVLELRWRDVSVVLTGDIGAGRRARARVGDAAGAAAHDQDPAPRQPDVELGAIRRARFVRRSRSSASAGAITSVTRCRRCSSATEPVGAEIFRTDQDGAVAVDTDGASLTVQT